MEKPRRPWPVVDGDEELVGHAAVRGHEAGHGAYVFEVCAIEPAYTAAIGAVWLGRGYDVINFITRNDRRYEAVYRVFEAEAAAIRERAEASS